VDIDLGALAATFGLPHRLVQDAAGFDRALDDALQRGQTGQLIEAVIDGDQSRRVHTQFWSQCEAG
jgi:2-succinyl-5-enolpyruvyl-6-hydroxy-3-cyclohexene-1-carboxylate synthase